jgi:predicted NUDIX family NTP pyrophosphohydrolase
VPRRSAGILLYRLAGEAPEVLIVHPGGPAWARKDAGVWSIPKGEYDETEDPLACALREFEEETGTALDAAAEPVELGAVKQRGGKIVTAWALEGDLDAESIHSNTFRMQWPPRSGSWATFPEVDRAGWFGLEEAREKLNPAQVEFLDRLAERLGHG